MFKTIREALARITLRWLLPVKDELSPARQKQVDQWQKYLEKTKK